MNFLKDILLFIFCCLLQSTLAFSQTNITPYQVELSVKRQGIQAGTMIITLYRTNRLWQASTIFEPSFFARMLGISKTNETTVFACDSEICSPRLYEFQNKEDKLKIEFDERLDYFIDAENKKSTLPINYQSNQTLFSTLVMQMNNNKQSFVLPILNDNEYKEYQIELVENHLLKTKLGDLITLQASIRNGDRKRLVWLAEALNWAPVRLETYKKDELRLEATVTNINKSP